MDIRAEKRPLLAQKGREEIERIYEERMPVYKSIADVVLDNGNGFTMAGALEAWRASWARGLIRRKYNEAPPVG